MAFWSGETLESRLPELVEEFDPDQIDCAAYTLRIGREVYISPSTTAEAATRTKTILKEKEGFVIPPGQFAFLLTEERVRVPETAIAFISMKARIKFKGLVNVSGFHVDPGYHGRLVFAVYNAGPAHVNLAQGDDCFLIWYASLEGKSGTYVRSGPPFDQIPSDLISPIAGQFHSLAGLADRIQQVEARQQVLDTRRTIILTLLGTLIVLVINLTAQTCRPATNPAVATNTSAPASSASPAPAPAPSGAAGSTAATPSNVSPAPTSTSPAQPTGSPAPTPAPNAGRPTRSPTGNSPAVPGDPAQTPNPSAQKDPPPRPQ
jgi:dCTP deaminase